MSDTDSRREGSREGGAGGGVVGGAGAAVYRDSAAPL